MAWLIYSTVGQDVIYQSIKKSDGSGIPIYTVLKSVLIKGGAHVAVRDKDSGKLHTPSHYVTEVSNEDMEVLNQDRVFLEHKKAGHIVAVEKPLLKIKEPSAESVLEDMTEKDKSAQKTEKDFHENPITKKVRVLKGKAEKGFDPNDINLSDDDKQE